jgi:hypothetical protein
MDAAELQRKSADIFGRVYDVLVEKAGASKDGEARDSFIAYHVERHTDKALLYSNSSEYRFMGLLRSGGKFRVSYDAFHVTYYYPEDDNETTRRIRTETNKALTPLYKEWIEQLAETIESHVAPK